MDLKGRSRHGTWVVPLLPAFVLALVLTALGAPVAPVAQAAGPRDNPDLVDLPRACADPDGYPLPGPCRLLPLRKGAPTIVLWGDSHAWQVIPALRTAIGRRRVNLVSTIMGGCPPMHAVLRDRTHPNPSNGCEHHGADAVAFLRAMKRSGAPFRLVVATSWELYHNVTDPPNAVDGRYPGYTNEWIETNARRALTAMPRLFRTLAKMRVPTDLVGQMPMVHLTPPPCDRGAYQCDLPRVGVLKDAVENNARIVEMRDLLSARGRVIRPAKSLCDSAVCRGRWRGLPVYFDRLHVGQRVSRLLSPYFAPSVRAALRGSVR